MNDLILSITFDDWLSDVCYDKYLWSFTNRSQRFAQSKLSVEVQIP